MKFYKKILGDGIKRKTPNYFSMPDGMRKVHTGNFAYLNIVDGPKDIVSRSWDEDAICDYTQIAFRPSEDLLLYIPKNSPFKQYFFVG